MTRPTRDVVVSTFPPLRDGIARYADQFADGLRPPFAVIRIGLPGSSADRVARLNGWLRPLRLVLYTRRSDRVHLMWHHEFYISGRVPSRIAAYASLAFTLRTRRTQVIVHERLPHAPVRAGVLRAAVLSVEAAARRAFFRSAAGLVFHSQWEKDLFAENCPGVLNDRNTRVADHGEFFRPLARESRQAARVELGLPQEKFVFVCIGFMGPHKGFDRAVRAFAQLPEGLAELHLVGSPLFENATLRKYVDELRSEVERVAGAHFKVTYVDDEEFDRWITAADAVIAPYRKVSSSGVVARARMLATRVIAANAGALPEQIGPDDILISSDDQLVDAMARLASASYRSDSD